jgi:hypothetical protein
MELEHKTHFFLIHTLNVVCLKASRILLKVDEA